MSKVDKSNLIIPNHLGIILDGNGRWANKRGLPRVLGHRKGALNLIDIAKSCNKLGIKYLTVYCFSTENWKRDKSEVSYLMNQPIKYYKKYKNKLFDSNMKIDTIGRKDRIPNDLLNCLIEAKDKTKDHTGLTIVLAIDYGSQDELITAIKNISLMAKNNEIDTEEIDVNLINKNLFTKDLPPLDLLIRTSGEYRISNFLLWQIAYSEFYFTDTLWPDFNENELLKALADYSKRDRRFGSAKDGIKK